MNIDIDKTNLLKEKYLPSINLEIQKSKTPVIFLDSNYIIDLLKYKKGINHLNTHVPELFHTLIECVNEKIIAIPIGEQCDEVLRNGENESWDFLLSLSKCSKFKSFLDIEQKQLLYGFKHYLDANKEYCFSFIDGLENDILFEENMISIRHQWPKNWRNEIKTEKIALANAMNELISSRSKKITFEQQLFCERMTYAGLLEKLFYKHTHNEYLNYSEQELINNMYFCIEEIEDNLPINDKVIEFNKYLSSNYFHFLPYFNISSKIYAKIITTTKYKASDLIDIINASSVLPFCNYYLTDRKMKNILMELSIDQEYSTEIFAFDNIESFFEILKRILEKHRKEV